MKRLWIHTVRAYIKLGLFLYYKKIAVLNADNVPKNQPVLILANHQNALLDPLLIATTNPRFSFFLTRAGVFNNALISKILKSLNMIPVYRIRDGWNNISNNNAIFGSCTDLLNNNESVAIFPEGNHNLNRTVRPLSKGFTRIVFDALDRFPDLNIQLMPVGVNYKNAEIFGDSVTLIYGNPIDSQQFNIENRNKAVIKLKNRIFEELTKLTVHIPSENYNDSLKTLKALNVDFLNPDSVNNCIANKFYNCEVSPSRKSSIFKKFFKILLIISLFIPYIIWKLVLQPKVKEKEFLSTFRFTIAITLVPLFMILVMIVLASFFSLNIACLYLFLVLFFDLMAVKL